MKKFGSEIFAAVGEKRLSEPFDAGAVRRACPGWADLTYHVFLAKHAVGNPGRNTELFCGLSRVAIASSTEIREEVTSHLPHPGQA
jgi:hypothetical protein